MSAEIQSETVRNEVLRRADWRFLLPNPKPLKTVCYTPGLVTDAVRLISDQTADPRYDQPSDCDLAVAVNPSDITLRSAWAALTPDGCCYTEWRSPINGGLKRIRKRLKKAGFEDISFYWFWPWLSRIRLRLWLPLRAPHLFNPLMFTHMGTGPLGGAVRTIFCNALFIGQKLGITFPVCAIARKANSTVQAPTSRPFSTVPKGSMALTPAAQQPESPTTFVLAIIRERWKTWHLGPLPNHLCHALVTGGPRSTSKVVALVFGESDCQPRLAVKMSRVPESVPGLMREAENLRTIESLSPRKIPGVPRVLFCQKYAGVLILIETALPGTPLFSVLRPENYRAIAFKATDWLARFAEASTHCSSSAWWTRLVEPAFGAFCENFGEVVKADRLQKARDALAIIKDLPMICEHRDFSPWNVAVNPDGELAIFDWESSELRGFPVTDLIYFLTYLTFSRTAAMRWHRYRESYRASLNPSSSTGRVVDDCLNTYLKRSGLDRTVLHPLRLLTWMIHSRSEYQRLIADNPGKPRPDLLRRCLFLGLWEEELRYGGRL